MKILKVVPVILVIGLVGAENNATTPETQKSTVPPTVTPAPHDTTTTKAPPTHSTSSAPSSSSTAPSTTSAPTSTSEQPTTHAPLTTTTPPPKEYYWNVTASNGTVCILAKADIKLGLTYTNASSNKEEHLDISVPHDAASSGQCGFWSQILKLSFGNDSITFNFTKNAETYRLAEIDSIIKVGSGNESSEFHLVSGPLKLYETHFNTSYVCSWSEPGTLQEDPKLNTTTKANVKITLKLMRFEAFRNSTDFAFSKEYSCPMDSPDIVPVMVGIALGILVAVVLIAYLVGRRSTQAQGYLSM